MVVVALVVTGTPSYNRGMDDDIEALASRFTGLDIQARRPGPGWPKKWRVTVIANKNERADYRTTAFGDALDEAVRATFIAVAAADAAIQANADSF